MSSIHFLAGMIPVACVTLAASYAMVTLVAVIVWRFPRATQKTSSRLPPVTILKPLCGAEPGLYENLRSFCVQDYPEFQIVFGVQDRADPALLVVARLVKEFPSLSIDIVVNSQQHGSNRKISNLINMESRARHDLLVMTDSDAFVRRDYLRTVTAPLLDHRVGLVTCIYRGVPTQGVWSRLGAMYINDWYMPSVLLAWLFGHQGYASGQTLCLRRDTLQAIGGLRAIADVLADDYQLGQLIRGQGLRVVLSSYVVAAEHHEPTLASLVHHEMRWMRTIRVLRPGSFAFLFITFSLPLAALGLGLAAFGATLSPTVEALFWTTATARVLVHFIPARRGELHASLTDFWLLPVRDLLVFWVWCRTFFTSRITWRGSEFDVDAQGVMRIPS